MGGLFDRFRRAGQTSASQEAGAVLHELPLTIIMLEGKTYSRLAQAFQEAGFLVTIVQGLQEAEESLRANPPALVIIFGGAAPATYAALRRLTPAPTLALLLPSAPEEDKLSALNAGIDDCQRSTIGLDEIILRALVLLRRSLPRERSDG